MSSKNRLQRFHNKLQLLDSRSTTTPATHTRIMAFGRANLYFVARIEMVVISRPKRMTCPSQKLLDNLTIGLDADWVKDYWA